LWLSPADNITQHGDDFPRFFDDPRSWERAARKIAVFSVAANYWLKSPPETARRQLAWLQTHGIKLSVAIPAVGVDKSVCGDGIEGMIWPHEADLVARRLKALAAEVDFFDLDLPMTAGHISNDDRSCHLSIKDTANRVAVSVREVRELYPQARFIDEEVPTGIAPSDWLANLSEWLAAYREATGEELYGLTMDVWWKFAWQVPVRETARMLKNRNIRSGIFLDASVGITASATEWIAEAQANACDMQRDGLAVDYIVVANWMNMRVKNLPETDPTTLTGLLDWFAANRNCQR
jgi:hypothetical protein